MKIDFNLFQSTYNYVVDDAIESLYDCKILRLSFNLIKCAINCIVAPNSVEGGGVLGNLVLLLFAQNFTRQQFKL